MHSYFRLYFLCIAFHKLVFIQSPDELQQGQAGPDVIVGLFCKGHERGEVRPQALGLADVKQPLGKSANTANN